MRPKIAAFKVHLFVMREWLLAHDKLHTVAAVLMIIWMGLALHLWRLTRRVEKLEKYIPDQSAQ